MVIKRDNIKHILIICGQGMGNTLLAIPMIAAFKQQFPNVKISVIVWRNGSESVLKGLSTIDELFVMSVDKPRYKVLFIWAKRLRFIKVSHCVVAWPGGLFSLLLALFSGASVRVGHMLGYYSWMSRIVLSKVICWKSSIKHDVRRNLELAKAFDIKVENPVLLQMESFTQNIQFADMFLSRHLKDNSTKLIGLVPGSGRSQQFKRWPIDYFIELSNQLISDFNGKIVLFVGPDEEGMADNIVKGIKGDTIVVSNKTIHEVAAIMSKCKIVITNDSGLMHVATTTTVPVVAIMGPTDPRRTRPFGVKNNVVTLGLPCSPCYNHFCLKFKCLHNKPFECLRALKPNIVFAAVTNVLRREEKLFCMKK